MEKSLGEKQIAIVGGGIGGLFCAYLLTLKGYSVTLYEAKSAVGLKWLVAGASGINCSTTYNLQEFASRYIGACERFLSYLQKWGPTNLCDFFVSLGCSIVKGSSHKILLAKEPSPKEILECWLDKIIKTNRFTLKLNHKLSNFSKTQEGFLLEFENGTRASSYLLILALGGASYKKTGSDGLWTTMLKSKGLQINDFLPANCGFHISYSSYLQGYFSNHRYLKNVALCLDKNYQDCDGKTKIRGDITFTPFGLEGLPVYQLGYQIRTFLQSKNRATLYIDLLPDYTIEDIYKKVGKGISSKKSSAHWLSNKLHLSSLAFTLVKDYLGQSFIDRLRLGSLTKAELSSLKAVAIEVDGIAPIDEAISVAGGVSLDELDYHLMVKKYPGLFLCGEMLDWEAPTGGFLMQGVFTMAYILCDGVPRYFNPIKKEGGNTVV